MANGKDQLAEGESGEDVGVVATLENAGQPKVALATHVRGAEGRAEHDIGEQVKRLTKRALGNVQRNGEDVGARTGEELSAKEGQLTLEGIGVARAGALGEHARRERGQSRLFGVELGAAGDDQRDLHEREFMLLDQLQRDAVRKRPAFEGGELEHRWLVERRDLRAIELLGEQRCRCEGEKEECGAFHWITAFLAASSSLPCGTTDTITRLVRRYCRTTRWTSAAETAL